MEKEKTCSAILKQIEDMLVIGMSLTNSEIIKNLATTYWNLANANETKEEE